MKKQGVQVTLRSLLAPAYWPLWLIVGVVWLLVQLPYRCQLWIGRGLGKWIYFFAADLRHIAKINIQLCFPKKTKEEQMLLLKKNFESVGIGLMEMAMGWWLSDTRLRRLLHMHGLENIYASMQKGKGVIVISPHFTSLELVGRLAAMQGIPFAVMYRPHKKKIIANMHAYFRRKIYSRYISRGHIRQTIRTLQDGMIVWYAHDIDPGAKHGVFVPFFRIQTATLTAVSRLVRITGADVVPIGFYRREEGGGYDLRFEPALTDFPTADEIDDSARLNRILERLILRCPTQYVWQYKRFKTRPGKERRFY